VAVVRLSLDLLFEIDALVTQAAQGSLTVDDLELPQEVGE
jgi:hypothetical protein